MRRFRQATLLAVAFINWSCGAASITDAGPVDAVSNIVVTPASPTLALSGQVTLQATVQDGNGGVVTGAAVTWTVRDPGIASVTPAGVVTALALGSTQVAATARGKSGIATITVQKTPVANVVVRPNTVSAVVGSTTPLIATVFDAAQNSLADRTVTWTSSNQGVATVDAGGVVTAVSAGTATITATSEGKSDASTFTISQGAVVSVAITPNPVSMVAGQTTQLAASARDSHGAIVSGRSVIWSSSNTGVASVSSQGVVSAVGAGSTTITATIDGVSATAAVTVTNVPVASVSVSGATTVLVGGSAQLSATPLDAGGAPLANRVIAWSSSNTAVATVSNTGVVTGVSPGAVTITASSEGKSGSLGVTISLVPVGSVSVSAPSSVQVGSTITATATVRDANGNVVTGRPITWSSNNTAAATVSSSGVITGVSAGTATITATSGTTSGSTVVNVTLVPVGTVTVTAPGTVQVGATVTATATVKDANGVIVSRPITWSSSDNNIATVSPAGVVTGVGVGAVTITATSGGISGTTSIGVILPPIASVVVSGPSAPIFVGATTQLTTTIKDVNGAVVTNRPVTWASNNPAAATVSGTGLVTAVAPGTATITATSGGVDGTITIDVTLVPIATVTVGAIPDVIVGATVTASATLVDVNGNPATRPITWSSNNTAVATVNATTGVVSGVATGTATITATSGGKTGSNTVNVLPPPIGSVVVSPQSPAVIVGGTVALGATVKDVNGTVVPNAPVTWTSSDQTVATVTSAGLVTTVAVGQATITATSSGVQGSTVVTVNPVPIATVTVSSAPSVAVGATTPATATVTDVNGVVVSNPSIAWSSSDVNFATVSPTGVVTGIRAGPVTITATSGGKSGSTNISVTAVILPITSVSVQPLSGSLTAGQSATLVATVSDANGPITNPAVTWSTSDASIADVSATGVITTSHTGTATITATSGGVSGTTTVTVVPGPAATVKLSMPAGVLVGIGTQGQIPVTAHDAFGNLITGRQFSWTSSDPTVVSIDGATGVMTAVSVGIGVTITATLDGISDTALVGVLP